MILENFIKCQGCEDPISGSGQVIQVRLGRLENGEFFAEEDIGYYHQGCEPDPQTEEHLAELYHKVERPLSLLLQPGMLDSQGWDRTVASTRNVLRRIMRKMGWKHSF